MYMSRPQRLAYWLFHALPHCSCCSAESAGCCKPLVGERQLRLRDGVGFRSEQFLLALDPPAITAERAVASNHAVAWDQHADMVVAVGGADRADRLGSTDGGCDLGVAASFASRDLAQLAPDRFLEGGARNVD